MIYVAPIVEGHGEVEAFPPLLHRIANAEGFQGQLLVNAPIRVKVGSFLNDTDYRRKMILLAAGKAVEREGTVIILFDCEDDCPAELGPRLLEQAKAVRNDVNIIVALAQREYESWFIAAAHSLRGHRGIPANLDAPPNHEEIRGAKEWLGRKMESSYDPITHQAEFGRAVDLTEARRNSSFDRLYKKVIGLFPSE